MNNFASAVQADPIRLDAAALLLAQAIRYPDLELAPYIAQLDAYAAALLPQLQGLSRRDQLAALSGYLFQQVGLRGNDEDYYDPANSFLNRVLSSRKGIPITLAVVYITVAQRLGLPAYGVGLPGHFVVGCPHEDKGMTFYIDCFNQGVLLEESEVISLAEQFLPESIPFTRDFLLPQPHRLILMRMLNNLRHIYTERDEVPLIIRVMELQALLYPSDLPLRRDLGLLYLTQAQWQAAGQMLRHYLYHYPDAPDREKIRQALNSVIDEVSRLN